MLSTRQRKKLLRRHLIISTSLAVQRENFGYFPRECRACNKQKKRVILICCSENRERTTIINYVYLKTQCILPMSNW